MEVNILHWLKTAEQLELKQAKSVFSSWTSFSFPIEFNGKISTDVPDPELKYSTSVWAVPFLTAEEVGLAGGLLSRLWHSNLHWLELS